MGFNSDIVSEAQVYAETVLGPLASEYKNLAGDYLRDNSARPVCEEELSEHVDKIEDVLEESNEYIDAFENFPQKSSAYIASDSDLWVSSDYEKDISSVNRFYEDILHQIYFTTRLLDESARSDVDVSGIWEKMSDDSSRL